MDPEQVDEFVMGYLKKKGFNSAAKHLQESLHNNNGSTFSSIDYHNDPELNKLIRSFSQSENDPSRYREGYSKLRSWGYNSLDLYKHELVRVMYPVFIHCYMDLVGKGHTQEARSFFNSFRKDHEMVHLRDLQKLGGVLAPSHLQEMEFARSLRQSKINIKICQYSYDLLLQYLHRTESTLMLGIINEHINFQVYSGQPNSASDDIEAVTIVGSFHETADHVNQKEIHWGLLEDSLEDRLEKTGGLLSDSEKGQGESKAGDMDDSKKRSAEIGKQGSSIKKLKKDKAGTATTKVARQETSTVLSSMPRVKPELAMPVMSTDVEESILEDLRNRVQLSSVAMPSVSFYTFVNTHNGLNSSSISHDGSLVAGGFSDSSIKVWDMAKIGQAGSSLRLSLCLLGSYRKSLSMGEAPAFFVDLLENGFGVKTEPENIDTSVQIGDRSYVIGRNHEGNPLFLGVQIHDKTTNKWSTPTVLGTGPKPCKAYSAIVLKQGRILVIKKGSASDDSIWFLEVDSPFVREQRKLLGKEVVAWSKGVRGNAEKPIVISGPSGVGKGTLIAMLMKEFPSMFGFSVSHTTRSPRCMEENGVHYHFTDKTVMEKEINDGKFLEFASVHGNLYGTSIESVEVVTDSGKRCILDIDVQGARSVKASSLDAVFIFVCPPSMKELEDRLRARGTETEEQIQKRLRNAEAEIKAGESSGIFEHILYNDNLEECYKNLKNVLRIIDDAPVNGVQVEGINLPKEHTVTKNGDKILIQETGEATKNNMIVLDLSSINGGAPGRTRGIVLDTVKSS